MAHDVFISYATEDKAVADAVCAALERRRIRCWIAPRDAQGGASYAQSVVAAIGVSRFMVLILSSHSTNSPHVIREVERAASGGPIVIPFRIEDVALSKPLRFFLGPGRGVDASTPPMDQHLSRLGDNIERLLKPAGSPSRPAPGSPSGLAPRRQPIRRPRLSVASQRAPEPQSAAAPQPRPGPSPAPPTVAGLAPAGRAVWFAGLGAAAGGLVSLAALLVYPTVDSAGALAAFWVSGGIIAGAVTWCWLLGSRRAPPATVLFGTLGGLTIGGLIEGASTYAFNVLPGDAALWIVASALLWGAYGWYGARSTDFAGGTRVGLYAVPALVGVSAIRFLAVGLLRSEWVWVLWLHDALQAIGWRLGLAASGSARPETRPNDLARAP